MRHHITYPEPPAKAEQKVPKFEVYIDWSTYTWRVEISDELEEYDGTFSVQFISNVVHIEWYQIPLTTELWEAIEEALRSIISMELR